MTTLSPIDFDNANALLGRFLANGRFFSLITPTGTGFSTYGNVGLTRWSGDFTEDSEGWFIYVRDLESGACWSVAPQPASAQGGQYSADSSPGLFRIDSRLADIEARLEVCVAADDVELRRLTLRNRSNRRRRLEITSYAEIMLNHPAADAAHPAFSKLFVQTEFIADRQLLLARRRPRGAGETSPWLHAGCIGPGALQYETSRVDFIGRGYSLADPRALGTTMPLGAHVGNVLDPIFTLRRGVELEPEEEVRLAFWLGAGADREAALSVAATIGTMAAITAAFSQAAERERKLQRELGPSEAQAAYFQSLAVALFYGRPDLRASPAILSRAQGPSLDLWRYEVPWGHRLVVAQVSEPAAPLAETLKQAQRYWHALGLPISLLLVHDSAATVANDTQLGILYRARAAIPADAFDRLCAAAQLVVEGTLPALEPPPPTQRETTGSAPSVTKSDSEEISEPTESLQFFNGCGGFSADGTEYVIRLEPDTAGRLHYPPLPWINVIANEQSGFLIGDSGAGYTWSRNSREHRLTPWSNDPVLDPHSEALYLRDEDSGDFWSPMPGPTPAGGTYEVRHGFGYTVFHHRSHNLEQEVCLFMARHDPVKIVRLRLTNRSDRPRRLSLFSFHRLVLGGVPADSSRFVVTEYDPAHALLRARNSFAGEFADGIAFTAAVLPEQARLTAYSGDRLTFIGPHGSLAHPHALLNSGALDGKLGAGLDPCFALQATLTLEAGTTVACAFLLGETTEAAAVPALVSRYRQPGAVEAALAEVKAYWRNLVSGIQVETPAPAIDLMLNGWTVYQNSSCRIWARSAFYQSGGAFGYRDQLQDAAALVYLQPTLTRNQILLHAAHQFVEGDVLHWWHPKPIERGLRTKFSDDLLWLPYVTAFYIGTTGDWSVLDESAPFLSAPLLAEGEDENYLTPELSGQTADIYEHCCRAIDRSLTRGVHGLPLMGTGDWNDGMNRVGRLGRGESVWMGFFLCHILDLFLPLCERRDDRGRIETYRTYMIDLRSALDDAGWDGEWYRRAYYDDGTPLGTRTDDECRIDALAQAWSVISKVASPDRAGQALDAVEAYLISDRDKLIRLLTPPFENTPHDPGYIKGYVKGVRENGGQYTHAACWVVRAMAEAGRRDRAAELLEMLSPVSQASTLQEVAIYQVEPYVIAADVYGAEPHVGRGGWTWYTGSAGWYYRVALESVLGIELMNGNTLRIQPRIPNRWPQVTIRYRLPDGATVYEIILRNPTGQAEAIVAATENGAVLPVDAGVALIGLQQDGALHRVEIQLG
ncbi:MAG: glycosyl transferase [Candidatus Competibacteraceae bacterium]